MAKIIILAMSFLFSALAFTTTCNVTANYRCTNGRAGSVVGAGNTALNAKENARDQARLRCQEAVDYIRFIEATANC